jgi:hypothetical protein
MGNGLILSCHLGDEMNELRRGKCRIWSGVNLESFQYPESKIDECPEIASKPLNFGIALSGGGFRAATLAIGTLRGLDLLGILSQSRYTSSNSGSSWVNGPLSYFQGDIKGFLGEYLPPEECTISNLRRIDLNSHSYVLCCGGNLKTFLKELRTIASVNDKDPRGFWSLAVGKVFFHDYGLNNFDSLPVLSNSLEDLQVQLPLPLNKFSSFDFQRGLPFPIINGSAVVHGSCVFAPIEFTPMYYSFPGKFQFHHKRKRFPIGGYLMEPFGFTSAPGRSQRTATKRLLNAPPDLDLPHHRSTSSASSRAASKYSYTLSPPPPPPRVIHVDVPHPRQLISVSDQAGISSSAITQVLSHRLTNKEGDALDFSVYPIWDPLHGHCHEMILADGGGSDNTGIIALLRRKVTKVFAMYAIDQSILSSADLRNMSHSNFADVAGLFGVMTCDGKTTIDGIRPDDFNRYHQVFPSEDYTRLVSGLRSRYLEGKPATFLLRTQALPNPLIAVPGNHAVELFFIVSAPSDHWVDLLPPEIQTKVMKQRKEIDSLLLKRRRNKTNGEMQQEVMEEKEDKVHSFGENEESESAVGEEEQWKQEKEKEEEDLLSHLEDLVSKLESKVQTFLSSVQAQAQAHLPNPSESLSLLREKLRNILKSSTLQHFPFPPIESFDYTAQLVNLLTNLMTWEVLESRDLLEEFLGTSLCSFEKTSADSQSDKLGSMNWMIEEV